LPHSADAIASAAPALALLSRHASVRDYRPEPVGDLLLECIVASAQRASTSSNLQTWSVVAVRDSERRQSLAALCGQQAHVAQAPLFLAWCADLSRLDRVCEARGYTQSTSHIESFLVAAVDAAIAAQNGALAAEAMGLGICYIGAIRNDPEGVVSLLSLPHHVFPLVGMTVGWSDQAPRAKPRLPLEAVLHVERYESSRDAEALVEYDRTMAGTGIYRDRQLPLSGRSGPVEAYGWLEHSARRVTQPSRASLRSAIEAQGFGLD
jgi:FMN reductase (NADPH)